MTFHGPSQYAYQLLSRTVDTLATAPDDVRSRILQAYSTFHPLTPEHIPDSLRKDYEWIVIQLTKREPQIDYQGRVQKGSVEVTLQHMRNSTGVKIAEKLLQLYYAIDRYVNPRGQPTTLTNKVTKNSLFDFDASGTKKSTS